MPEPKRMVLSYIGPEAKQFKREHHDKVQILSNTYKDLANVSSGEEGILMPPSGCHEDVQNFLERLVKLEEKESEREELSFLAELYNRWYKKGGRAFEADLVSLFKKTKPSLSTYVADRFRNMVRRGITLETEEGDSTLLEACKDVLAEHGKFDANDYIQAQRFVLERNSNEHEDVDLPAFVKKAKEGKLTSKVAKVSSVINVLGENY